MRLLLIFISFTVFKLFAQNTLIHDDVEFSKMEACSNGDLLGIKGNDIVRLDSSFNLVWSKNNLTHVGDAFLALTSDDSSRALVLYRTDSSYVFSRIDTLGNLDWRYETQFEFGGYPSGDVVFDGTGYVLTMIGSYDTTTAKYGLVVQRLDESLNLIWSKRISPYNAANPSSVKVKVGHDDNIYLLWNSDYSYPDNVSVMTKLEMNGDVIYNQRLGPDCGKYQSFDLLPDGGLVVTGKNYDDANKGLKISVCDENGYIKGTKYGDLSDYGFGGYDTYVYVRNDGRYVVSYSYQAGLGGQLITNFTFFDNHKAIGKFQFLPEFPTGAPEFPGPAEGRILAIDKNDRLYFTGVRYNDGLDVVRKNFGRFIWYNETCETGNSASANFQYKTDYSGRVNLIDSNLVTIASISVIDDLISSAFSSTFYCTSSTIVPTPSETGNHLYGDTLAASFCDFESDDTTIFDLGLNHYLEENINIAIFPNPASTEFTIVSDLSINKISCYDLQGKEIEIEYSLDLGKGKVKINEDFQGILLLSITTNSGQRLIKKVVVQ